MWVTNWAAQHTEHIILTMKKVCGGCIMMWGCFSSTGTGKLVRFDMKTDEANYR